MQILVSIGTVGAYPQIGEILSLCDFFVRLSRPYLFSRSCAQVEPLDRFSRFMAQTTGTALHDNNEASAKVIAQYGRQWKPKTAFLGHKMSVGRCGAAVTQLQTAYKYYILGYGRVQNLETAGPLGSLLRSTDGEGLPRLPQQQEQDCLLI